MKFVIKYYTISTALLTGLFLSFQLIGQLPDPDANFSFDNCDFNDIGGVFVDNTITGSPACVCGPSSNAMRFNGVDQFAVLDPDLKDLFIDDFTMSFYFWVEDTDRPTNIFSIKRENDCLTRDSTMQIQYFPFSNTIEIDLVKNLGDNLKFIGDLDPDICWHHFVLIKEDTRYSAYLDEMFIASTDQGTSYEMADTSQVFLATSPCVGLINDLFDGRIDELRFYSQAFNVNELQELDLNPDQITNENLTVFLGESVQVGTGGTCASGFSWNDTQDFDDVNALEPLITPEETTTYILTFDHGDCITIDSLTINVVTEDDLNCDELLLPKAFTPNGDGLNDTYGISNSFLIDELLYFEIYDRWGAKIFETRDIAEKWDGIFKSTVMNPAMFVYKVKYTCNDEERLAVGNFSIIR